MRDAISIMLVAAILSGCAQPVEMKTKFDTVEHGPYREVGNSEIQGYVSLMDYDGGEVTCARNKVYLVPATSFYREIFDHVRAGEEPKLGDNGPPPGWKSIIKETECDYWGHFVFSGLSGGSWYVITGVRWKLNQYLTVDCSLMKEVKLRNGQRMRIVLRDSNVAPSGFMDWLRYGVVGLVVNSVSEFQSTQGSSPSPRAR